MAGLASVGGFCCPVPPEPRLGLRRAQDLKCGCQTAVRQRGEPPQSCHSQLCNGPITAVPYRAKTAPLPRASILFRPHGDDRHCLCRSGVVVEAPGTAPGSATLIPNGVYCHSRSPDTEKYKPFCGRVEGLSTRVCCGAGLRRSSACGVVAPTRQGGAAASPWLTV